MVRLHRMTIFMAKDSVPSHIAPVISDTPGLMPWSNVRKRPCHDPGTQRSATAVPTAPPSAWAACAGCTHLFIQVFEGPSAAPGGVLRNSRSLPTQDEVAVFRVHNFI